MELRKFRNKYDLDLITASTSNIILGTLVWDPVFGKPRFDANGMPDHIYMPILDADLIDQNILEKEINVLKNIDFGPSAFAELEVEFDFDSNIELSIPQIDSIKAEVNAKRNLFKKFTFNNIKSKAMGTLDRIKLDSYIEELRENKWEDYDGKIRRVYMITELYYGEINVIIKSKFSSNLSADVINVFNTVAKTEIGNDISYKFSNDSVPFAMRLERVKHFNG